MKSLKPAERLIVAADFKPVLHGGRSGVMKRILAFAHQLKNLGVYLKVNSALRALGYDLIDGIHDAGLRVFADFKLNDIPETLLTDGEFLKEAQPELLTVMCSTGVDGMRKLKSELPNIEILGVTVLTTFNDEECERSFGDTVENKVHEFALMAEEAEIDGLILSPKDLEFIQDNTTRQFSLNTPGIRPKWSLVEGDDQKRVATPAQAIKAGATRIVVGRPIVQAKDPYDAVMRTIEEIASVS